MQENASQTSMVVTFLSDCPAPPGFQNITKRKFKDIFSDMLRNFDLKILETGIANQRYSENIVALMIYCHEVGLATELAAFVSKLVAEAETVDQVVLETILVNATLVLADRLEASDAEVQNPQHQRFVRCVLSIYIIQRVGAKPEGPENSTLPTVTCKCKDCRVLNRSYAILRRHNNATRWVMSAGNI
jgi:hypothetical protein